MPVAICLLASCASTPEPIEPLLPPPVDVGIRHWAGSALSGRRPGSAPTEAIDPSDCLGVTFDIYYVDGAPMAGLAPIASRARLAIGARGGEPLLPVSDLSLGARVGIGPEAEGVLHYLDALASDISRLAHVRSMRGALPRGASVGAHATAVEAEVSGEGRTVRRRVAVLISRDAEDVVSAALFVDGIAPDRIADEDFEAIDVFKRQIVLLEEAPRIDGAPLVLGFPSRFEPSSGRAFVVVIRVCSADAVETDTQARAVARCGADLQAEAEDARALAADVEPGEVARRSLAAGLDALDTARSQRPALVFLAGSSDAPLALDLTLAADDATIADWVRSLETATGDEADPAPADPSVDWLLERTAFELLARRLDSDDLGTDLRGLLAQHAGEAGRFPGAISAALSRCPDRAAFEAALVAENLDFLATSDPSSRVRAFDWLAARGRAPDGYDPLGPRDARRAALTTAESASEQTAEEGGSR